MGEFRSELGLPGSQQRQTKTERQIVDQYQHVGVWGRRGTEGEAGKCVTSPVGKMAMEKKARGFRRETPWGGGSGGKLVGHLDNGLGGGVGANLFIRMQNQKKGPAEDRRKGGSRGGGGEQEVGDRLWWVGRPRKCNQ